jgi:Ca2+-binding EF-hand superfamily protein
MDEPRFDDDGDGFLSKAELSRGLRSLAIGLSTRELDELCRIADRDGDGRSALRVARAVATSDRARPSTVM